MVPMQRPLPQPRGRHFSASETSLRTVTSTWQQFATYQSMISRDGQLPTVSRRDVAGPEPVGRPQEVSFDCECHGILSARRNPAGRGLLWDYLSWP